MHKHIYKQRPTYNVHVKGITVPGGQRLAPLSGSGTCSQSSTTHAGSSTYEQYAYTYGKGEGRKAEILTFLPFSFCCIQCRSSTTCTTVLIEPLHWCTTMRVIYTQSYTAAEGNITTFFQDVHKKKRGGYKHVVVLSLRSCEGVPAGHKIVLFS